MKTIWLVVPKTVVKRIYINDNKYIQIYKPRSKRRIQHRPKKCKRIIECAHREASEIKDIKKVCVIINVKYEIDTQTPGDIPLL